MKTHSTENEGPLSLSRKKDLVPLVERVLARAAISIDQIPQPLKEFYEFWQPENSKDPSQLYFLCSKINEHFTSITSYFVKIFKDNSVEFNDSGIKEGGLFQQQIFANIQSNIPQALSLLMSYSEYIALLALELESSKSLGEEERKETCNRVSHFLQQFPPIIKEEYFCLGGSGSRLNKVTSFLKVSDIRVLAHQKLTSLYVDKFSNIFNPGSQVHIQPLLEWLIGVNLKLIKKYDPNFQNLIEKIKPETVLEFVFNYDENLSAEINQIFDHIKEDYKRIIDNTSLSEKNFLKKLSRLTNKLKVFSCKMVSRFLLKKNLEHQEVKKKSLVK